MSREVADAFISVHGDLAPFRKGLEKATAPMKDWADEQARSFTDAWGDRVNKDLTKKWSSIVDAMHSGKKMDFSRMIENFDGSDLDAASEKIHAFMDTLLEAEKISADSHRTTVQAIDEEIKARQRAHFLQQDMLADEKLWNRQHVQMMDDLAAARKRALDQDLFDLGQSQLLQEKYNASFEKMMRDNRLDGLTRDFRAMAKAASEMDWSTMAKGFDSLDEFRTRIEEVNTAMREQGLISEDNARRVRADVDAFIMGEKDKAAAAQATADEAARSAAADSKAKADALDAAKALREEQERYNKSLEGMVKAAKIRMIERDYRSLTDAVASGDWSNIARGSENIDQMRQNVSRAMIEMLRMGRIGEEEFASLGKSMSKATANAKDFNISFKDAGDKGEDAGNRSGKAFTKFGAVLSSVWNTSKGLREHLGGFAGLNVMGDLIKEGLDFVHNLDRIAVSAGIATTKLATMGSLAGSSLAGLVTIAGDIADSLGGISVLLPAFLTGAGIAIGVAVAAFKDLKTELKDLGPLFTKLQDSISAKFWKEAKAPIEEMVRGLMPTLNTQLGITATRLGAITGEFARAFKDSASPERVTTMMERLNAALDRGKAAVAPLVRAFVNLGDTGTKYFGRAADAIVGMSENFDRFIQKAKDSGDLDKWAEAGIKGFKDMGRALDGVFGIFNAFESAARAAGSGGLSSFADRLQAVAAALQGPAFQTAMTQVLQGMNSLVSSLGTAIIGLGPAFASIAPFFKAGLEDIGVAVGTLIGYVGKVLEDPQIHVALINFTGAIESAVKKLEPAVKPFTDSLAHAIELLGKILVNVADIVAYFTVTFSPTLDSMSAKLETLLDPLKNSVKGVIDALSPVLKAIDEDILGPVTAAMRDKILPAFDELVKAWAPVLAKMVADLGPVIKPLVDEILPALIKLVGDAAPVVGKLFDLFTPTLAGIMTSIAAALTNISDAVKVLKGELPVTELRIFKNFSEDEIKKQIEEDAKPKSWGEILSTAFNENIGKATEFTMRDKIGPMIGGFFNWFGGEWQKGIESVQKGNFGSSDQGAAIWNEFVSRPIQQVKDAFAHANDKGGLNETVNQWFDDTFFKPIREAWDGFWRGLDGWWKDTKAGFQGWMKDTFNIGAIFGGKEAKITNNGGIGGGAGGKGMGVGATILPQMLDQEAEGSFLDTFIAGIQEKAGQMWTSITEALTNFGTDVMTNWNSFWDGIGAKVSEIWDTVVLWVQTKAGEISANVGQFITDVGTNWNAFWDGVNQKVSDIWTAVTTWVQTKAEEIRSGIATWAADVQNNWNSFWDGVNQKVTDIWNTVTSWIQTKRDEIKNGIDSFVTDVRNNWNSFWDGVSNTVRDAWQYVLSWIQGKVNEIRNNIFNFVNDVRTNWDNFWNGVKDTVTTAWTNVSSGIQTGIDNAVTFVKGLPGKITSALGNLGNLLLNAGSSIMGGLKKGLEDGFSTVKNFVGGIAQWIKDNKGPLPYDRVLLVPAGQAIMAGLRSGLDDGVAPLTNQLQSITALLSDTLTEGFARSKMYIAGADAALGLADGIKANAAAVQAAMGDIVTDPSATLSVAGGVGGTTPGATILNVEAGAVQVITPTEDPQLVANKTIDGLISVASNL